MAEENDNKLKKLLRTNISMDRLDKLGLEMEVSNVDFKIQLITGVFKFMRLIAVESDEGKHYLRTILSSKLKYNSKDMKKTHMNLTRSLNTF